MISLNAYFWFILATLAIDHVLQVLGNLFNLRALSATAPVGFEDVFDADGYARSQAYTQANTRLDLVSTTTSLTIFLAFWWLGGFGALDRVVRDWTAHSMGQGLLYISLLYLGSTLVSLPFSIYETFGLEARFGFNRTRWTTFVADRLKGFCLSALLGLPLLAALLWVFQALGVHAWWVAWLLFTAVSLLLIYLAPQWILPWYHKFQPLEDGPLKAAIHQLADRCRFPLREVYQIDGSRRSTKTNAFFTGFGKNKRIALFDTLIQNHSREGLVAVVAHEIGHYRKHHILKHMAFGLVETGVLFFLLGRFLNRPGLFQAFGVAEPSIYGSLVLFSFVFSPLSRLLHLGSLMMSRKHEFEADAYAAEMTGDPLALTTSLKKLAQENLTNLTPHPFFVFLNYSHPPIVERIAAIEK